MIICLSTFFPNLEPATLNPKPETLSRFIHALARPSDRLAPLVEPADNKRGAQPQLAIPTQSRTLSNRSCSHQTADSSTIASKEALPLFPTRLRLASIASLDQAPAAIHPRVAPPKPFARQSLWCANSPRMK